MRTPIITLVLATLAAPGAVLGADVTVLASTAITEAYNEILPQFEKASGHKVTTTWAGSADIVKKVQDGEVFDLVIGSSALVADLVKANRIAAASRVDLAASGVGIAVRPGMAKPDISSTDALTRALLSAKTIGYSSGPSGAYLTGLFERLGIAGAIKGKLKQSPPGVPVGTLIAGGEVEIGFQQISEVLHYPGIVFVGPLPSDVQLMTTFTGGVHVAAQQPDAAQALLRFFTSPAAVPAIARSGMEPR